MMTRLQNKQITIATAASDAPKIVSDKTTVFRAPLLMKQLLTRSTSD